MASWRTPSSLGSVQLAALVLGLAACGVPRPGPGTDAASTDAAAPPCVLEPDSWCPVNDEGAPSPRWFHTAVWTGEEMIVWGGMLEAFFYNSSLHAWQATNTGARYRPDTDTWTPTSLEGAPSPRRGHTAVWTGREMIVWGGAGYEVSFLWAVPAPDAARYDPATDTWSPVTDEAAPAPRLGHTAVWTGAEMIVWGGGGHEEVQGPFRTFASGGHYDPVADSWIPTGAESVPLPRTSHSAVWTGAEMIVWGGMEHPEKLQGGGTLSDTGERYDPGTGVWSNLAAQPPCDYPRSWSHALWAGDRMILWGWAASGCIYDPACDCWQSVGGGGSDVDVASGGVDPLWTGSEMLVWAGFTFQNGSYGVYWPTIAGGRYDPATDTWEEIPEEGMPPGRRGYYRGVWTGSEAIYWGGLRDVNYDSGMLEEEFRLLGDGGRYRP